MRPTRASGKTGWTWSAQFRPGRSNVRFNMPQAYCHPQYDDPEMQAYCDALPPRVQDFLARSGSAPTTLGELMEVAEHLRQTL